MERLITYAKKGTLADYRRINQFVNHPPTLKRIIETSKRYSDRNGGYTQIVKIGYRKGDSAEKAILKLV